MRLHQKFAFLCALSSKRFLLFVCAFIKTFLFSFVSLHQNACFFFLCAYFETLFFSQVRLHYFCSYVCASTSKWFLLLVCAYTSLCFFSRVFASKCLLFLKCAYIIMVAFIHVRLHQHVCFYSCALASYFASTCVRLHQKVWIFSCAPTYEGLHVPFCACMHQMSIINFSRVWPCQNVKIFAFSTSKWLDIIVFANI